MTRVSRSHPVIVVLVPLNEEAPPGLGALDALAELHVVNDRAGLEAHVDDADILAVYDFRTPLVHDLGKRAAGPSWIHAASAGVDAVLTPAVLDHDTVVTNAQGVFDDAIAEYVLATLLIFAKDLLTTLSLQREHTWRHRESHRLAGRQVLVVGAGSIGGAIGRLCGAAGMSVRGVARTARPDDPDFDAVVSIDQLHAELATADDVVIATPLTAATHHLIDAEALAAMRPGTNLVNIGRGPVIDQHALVDALQRGHVGAAALDVFEEEPLPADHQLWDMANVIVSPHMSGDVVGWVAALGEQFIANVERWRAGEPLHHVVDKRAMATTTGATPT